MAWKVDIQAPVLPTSSSTRSFISPAALLVKVMARMLYGGMSSRISLAMRLVTARIWGPRGAKPKDGAAPAATAQAAETSAQPGSEA